MYFKSNPKHNHTVPFLTITGDQRQLIGLYSDAWNCLLITLRKLKNATIFKSLLQHHLLVSLYMGVRLTLTHVNARTNCRYYLAILCDGNFFL